MPSLLSTFKSHLQRTKEPVKMSGGTDIVAWRYMEDLPEDRTKLSRAWKLLQSHSGVPKNKLEEHVREVREKAWAVFPYPCIGRWRFLDIYLPDVPEYPGILARVKAGAVFLDVGCCFGQILRQLALDGAPTQNLIGVDLRQEYVDLGYDLFLDRGKFGARFVTGDMLKPDDPSLAALDGTVDIIHAASFFHLFGWDDQVRAGERMVRFFRPGTQAMVLGRQVGTKEPEDFEKRTELSRYHHSPETLQKLWDVIGERTGTKWSVWAELMLLIPDMDAPREGIRFVVTRVLDGDSK